MSKVEEVSIEEKVETLKTKLGLTNISTLSTKSKDTMISIRALIKVLKTVVQLPAVENWGTAKDPRIGIKLKESVEAVDNVINQLLIDSIMYKNI